MQRRRLVLITGGNAGIGRAAARQMAEAGCEVLIGCRNEARGAAAAEQLRREVPGAAIGVLQVDMSSLQSIRTAAAQVTRLDVLIHNAAFFDIRAKTRTETAEGFETTWVTNHLGPVLLTDLLMPRLRESEDSRVIAITSKGLTMFPRLAVELADPEYKTRRFSVPRAYYQSKLAHLTWMLDQAERWREARVRFHGIRVTNVKVDLDRYPGIAWPLRAMYRLKSAFALAPEEMARAYTWAATSNEAGMNTGQYWDAPNTPAQVSRWATVKENRAALDALTRRQLMEV